MMISSLRSQIGFICWLTTVSSTWNECNAFLNHGPRFATTPTLTLTPTPTTTPTTTSTTLSSSLDDSNDSGDKMSSNERDVFEQLTKDFLLENGKPSLLSGGFQNGNGNDNDSNGNGNDNDSNGNDNDNGDNNNVAFAFPSAMPPKNPFAQSMLEKQQAMKKSLYSDEELMAVLNIHGEVSDETMPLEGAADKENDILGDGGGGGGGDDTIPSLHDLVLNTIQSDASDSDTTTTSDDTVSSGVTPTASIQIDSAMKDKIKNIRAIASDVDGTILTSQQTMHPRTRMAIKRAIKIASSKSANQHKGVDADDDGGLQYFFPATGKSRKGALDSLGIEIGGLIAKENVPGVYLQGLFCVDGSGNVVFEKKLNIDAIAATEDLVAEHGISVVAYDGDHLFTTQQTDIVVHLNEHYGEPLPQLLISENNDDIQSLSSYSKSFHKLLLMDDDTEKIEKIVRPKLEELASKFDACVTQALPTMLELLPKGCSKANGVSKLCEALSIDVQKELLAIGDAENDAEMLKISCIGVAVGNATPIAKDVADIVLDETNEEGAAGVAIELFGLSNDLTL
jgi:hydroxymethylpyrimidine pyrophosphatase-like HAD family hydrolase